MDNSLLNAAAKAKKDEFYTTYEDIEKEMRYYKEYFYNKIIYCNCDDPHSNFVKYFIDNFSSLGLKKLVATGLQNIVFIYDGKTKQENSLKSGSFDSEECVKFLQEADIVITNPPFSLFKEYFALLVKYNKKFIILGNMNAVTYKKLFPLFKRGELQLGPSIHSGDRKFYVPDDYPLEAAGCGYDEEGKRYIKVKGVRWYTNLLGTTELNRELEFAATYEPQLYPKYDNYNAINVDRIKDIPRDYYETIGVPITIFDYDYNKLFSIIGFTNDLNGDGGKGLKGDLMIKGKTKYKRIFIRRKENS